ncbi:MAG: tetratricopeptide repeat protein [Planctomycetaceae bacterium]|nr:tetratricopeptide repeat protein [Planctomycetaceae bacterium]
MFGFPVSARAEIRFLCSASLVVTTICLAMSGCGQTRGHLAKSQSKGISSEERALRLEVARVHEQEGRYDKAERALEDLQTQSPDSAEVLHRLGVVMVRQGQIEEGMDNLLQAVALDNQNLLYLNDLGYAYLTIGDLEAAEGIFRDALQISAKDPRTTNNLALAVGYQGDITEAFMLFRRNMSEGEALANIAYIHTQRGELDEALARYSEALDRDPTLKNAADAMIQISSIQKRMDQNPTQSKIARQTTDSEGFQSPIELTNGVQPESTR